MGTACYVRIGPPDLITTVNLNLDVEPIPTLGPRQFQLLMSGYWLTMLTIEILWAQNPVQWSDLLVVVLTCYFKISITNLGEQYQQHTFPKGDWQVNIDNSHIIQVLEAKFAVIADMITNQKKPEFHIITTPSQIRSKLNSTVINGDSTSLSDKMVI